MWILPHYVKQSIANNSKSHMCAMDKSSSFAFSLHNVDSRFRNFMRSYPEIVYYSLMRFATDQAIAEFWCRYLTVPAGVQHDVTAVRRWFCCKIVHGSKCIWRMSAQRRIHCINRTCGSLSSQNSQTPLGAESSFGFGRHCVPCRIAVVYPERASITSIFSLTPSIKENITTENLGISANQLILSAGIQRWLLRVVLDTSPSHSQCFTSTCGTVSSL